MSVTAAACKSMQLGREETVRSSTREPTRSFLRIVSNGDRLKSREASPPQGLKGVAGKARLLVSVRKRGELLEGPSRAVRGDLA
jgi:hypothetical protein